MGGGGSACPRLSAGWAPVLFLQPKLGKVRRRSRGQIPPRGMRARLDAFQHTWCFAQERPKYTAEREQGGMQRVLCQHQALLPPCIASVHHRHCAPCSITCTMLHHLHCAPLAPRTAAMHHLHHAPLAPCTAAVHPLHHSPLAPCTAAMHHLQNAPLAPRTAAMHLLHHAPLAPCTAAMHLLHHAPLAPCTAAMHPLHHAPLAPRTAAMHQHTHQEPSASEQWGMEDQVELWGN